MYIKKHSTAAAFAVLAVFFLGCEERIIGPVTRDTLTDPFVQPRVVFTYPANNAQGPFNVYNPGDGYDYPHFIVRFNKYMFTPEILRAIRVEGFDEPVQVQLYYPTPQFIDIIGFRVLEQFPWYSYYHPYEIGSAYTVTVDTGAQDINGNRTFQPYRFTFIPEPYFRVLRIFPGNGDTTSYLPFNVHLMFNSSVASAIFPFLQITPQTTGTWLISTWNDSMSLDFIPQNLLPFNTTYTLRVLQGAPDKLGNLLPREYRSSFTTTPFRVRTTYPSEGNTDVFLNSSIYVIFTGQIDTGTVRSAWTISPPAAGNFSMFAGSDNFTFIPSNGFLGSTRYTVTLSTALRAGNGTPLSAPFSFSFTTAPFRVTATSPFNGQTSVSRSTSIWFYFTGYLDISTVIPAFSISPTTPGTFNLTEGSSYFSFTPNGLLLPNTTYSVTLASSLRSKSGSNLTAPYTFSFTTGN